MFPNGSGGTGRFAHFAGRLSVSRRGLLKEISSLSVNLFTRRAGNGISVVSLIS